MSETPAEIVIIEPEPETLDISQFAISSRQIIIIEQLADISNMFGTLMGFAQHIDGTLAALVQSNNEIGTSQTQMQQAVTNIFATAQNSPMAKMMGLGKGGKSE